MKATAHALVDHVDRHHRAPLEAAAVAAARGAFGRLADVERVEVFLSREAPGSERWRVGIDVIRSGGRVVRAAATARLPHAALDDACIAAWASLRGADAPRAA